MSLRGESWLLAEVDVELVGGAITYRRLEIQRIDEACAASYTDEDALDACIAAAAQGDADASRALRMVNFQKEV
jgi:hypothetical protein